MNLPNMRPLRSAVVIVAVCAFASGVAVPSVAAGGGGAPATTPSADGRSVSGAGKGLTVSQAVGLDPAGQSLTVAGSGYDEAKGVYVSLCVIPPTGATPSPCGGGVDRENTSGASAWISSDPPSYAANVSQPYGPGGSFSATIEISPAINADLDCRQVRCAVVTRNDHTRGSDRSQDLLIPVTFADPAAPAPPADPVTSTTTPPSTTTTTTTTTLPLPLTAFAPAAVLSADGRSIDDGTRTMTVDAVDGLDPEGAPVVVEGSGFDTDIGVYVALCRIPEADATPGPCTSGGAMSAWLSSSPPDYGTDLATPLGEGGTFRVELHAPAEIDDTTDCRVDPCAITVRRDDTASDDRTSDLFVPVDFAPKSPTTTEAATTDTDESDDGADDVDLAAVDVSSDDDGAPSGPLVALALGLVVIAGGVAWFVRRRSAP